MQWINAASLVVIPQTFTCIYPKPCSKMTSLSNRNQKPLLPKIFPFLFKITLVHLSNIRNLHFINAVLDTLPLMIVAYPLSVSIRNLYSYSNCINTQSARASLRWQTDQNIFVRSAEYLLSLIRGWYTKIQPHLLSSVSQ